MPQPIAMKKPAMPQLVNTRNAAEILGRSAATETMARRGSRAELDRTARSG